jgi:peptidoglycan/LPS O-acetylase OafA/YrhL
VDDAAAPRQFGFIDALRGYAILAVVATHVQLLTPDLPFVVKRWADFGAYGVPLFFVVSAATLTSSWEARADGAAAFYIRRVFRIAPMFWLAIAYYLLFPWPWRAFWSPHGLDWATVALTAVFLHGWSPESLNVVPGGWSIATEWGFYLLFPFLVGALRSFWSALGASLAMLATMTLSPPAVGGWLAALFPQTPPVLVAWFQTFWLPGNLYIFLAGMACWRATKAFETPRWVAELEVAAAVLVAVVYPLLWDQPLKYAPAPCFAFALLVHGLASGGGRYLVFGATRRLGTLSFSVYLIHFAIITALIGAHPSLPGAHGLDYALFYALVLGASYLIAEVTYRTVERPMIRLGGQLAARVAAMSAPRRAHETTAEEAAQPPR